MVWRVERGMGYNITIGEAQIDPPSASEASEWPPIGVRVRGVLSRDAPSFLGDEMTGQTSERSLSYTAWAEFCEAVGLYRLFFGVERGQASERGGNAGLMSRHPGAAVLTKAHHEEIAAALDRYRSAHPEARPGWRVPVEGGDWFRGPWQPDTEHLDGNLARLIWLEWWVRWALANCKIPAVGNT